MINLLLIIFSTLNFSFAIDDQCSYFKYCGSNKNNTQSSSQSIPSASMASSFNPSNISKIKGVGLEAIVQPNNPLGYNIVSGTGKFGGALISPTLENSFFGNRSIELDEVYMERRAEKKRYKDKKFNVALGINITTKKNYSLDLGVSLKYNPKIKKVNPGIGISTSILFLNLGYAYYKDDAYIDFGSRINNTTGVPYATIYGAPTYKEKFSVQTFSIGTKIGSLALDIGQIKTHYNFYNSDTTIRIYSSAYNYKNFLFNLAFRNEDSPNMKEVDHMLVPERKQNDIYFGVQYLINNHLLVGMGYNNFLLKELAGTITIYL